MRDIRSKVTAASVLLLLAGAAATTVAVFDLMSGQRSIFSEFFVGPLALLAGVLSVVILAKDPFPSRASNRDESHLTKAHVLRFKVGDHEIHQVSYRWDQVWGWLTVTVDGVLVEKSLTTFTFRLVKVVEFVVGTQERHSVRIEKRRRLMGSFAQPQPITAFVDGVVIATHDGASTR